MGMAAGQARLLSITSRMSDNELRAQLINNDKMRLATKSSQASENYVKALNEAQMMFTNYDANNNTSFQKLTFNAMTTFNPYNNQYSLSNASGKLLVSERDAANFKNSTDLKDFLKNYGLEQTTTYFKGLPTVNGQVQYPTTAADAEGNVIFANAGTPEQLQRLYEGVGDTPSYDNILGSDYYYKYIDKLDTYLTTQEDLYATVGSTMLEIFNEQKLSNGKKIGELNGNPSPIETGNAKEYCTSIANFINGMKTGKYLIQNEDTQNYLSTLELKATNASYGWDTDVLGQEDVEYKDGYTIVNGSFAIGPLGVNAYRLDEDGKPDLTKPLGNASITTSGSKYNLTYTEDDGQKVEISGIPTTSAANDEKTKIQVKSQIEDDEIVSIAKNIIRSLQNSIYNIWDPTNEDFVDKNSIEYKDYLEAANELAATLGITNLGTKLSDLEKLADISSYSFTINDPEKRSQFTNIVNSITIDNVLNTYGEPKYTWIDTSKPNDSYNVNGEAKAQWYTNLYERMRRTGYEAIKDGLASSPEWIKFALESGVVTMEQVDESNNWKTIIYSNCSDITEQTDSAAVAKAEAEYNAAMNKIENKDKMYDLELKNIDTEHNSLQTEYDSIKSAIDKNIERTFKLYG